MQNKIVRAVLFAAALAIILFSGWKLLGIYREYAEGVELYNSLEAEFLKYMPRDEAPVTTKTTADSEAPEDTAEATQQAETTAQPESGGLPAQVDFESLLKTCKDVVGWIYSEGTKISYPVVQSNDNSYYLRRMLNGYYNIAGTIFMDYRNAADMTDYNTIIYGHHMKNGSMFGSLWDYKKQSYYDEHPMLWLFTPDGNYQLEVIAGFIIPSTSESYTFFDSEEALRDYLSRAVEQSDFESTVNIEDVSRIVTLSTCTYEYDDARYVVVCSVVPYYTARS